MRRFFPALLACLGVAATAFCLPANARVFVGVGIGLPAVLVAPPVLAYEPPYAGAYVVGPHVYHPGYFRYGYGYGYGVGYRVPYGYRLGYRHGFAHGRPWR